MLKRSAFTVGGLSLDNFPTWFVSSDQKMHGPQNITRPAVSLPFQRGELSLPRSRTVGAAEWSVSMVIGGSTYYDMLKNKGKLEAAFSPAEGLVTIQERFAAGGAVWETEGQLVSAEIDRPWDSYEDVMEATYTFRIPSGVWREGPFSQSVSATGTFTHPAAGGSAPITRCTVKFTTTSDSSSFRIQAPGTEDNGVSFYAQSRVSSGAKLTLDTETYVLLDQYGTRYDGLVEPGPVPFYIPASGQYRITAHSGITDTTIYADRTWF